LADAKAAIETRRIDYNTVRRHSSLDGATPNQFARISAGVRRLTPARPNKENEDRKPEDFTLSPWRILGAGSCGTRAGDRRGMERGSSPELLQLLQNLHPGYLEVVHPC
jgi:hypothetical protein